MLIFTKALSTLPANSLIVDFGAGDAQLAQDLSKLPVGLKVISFDLVSKNGWVVVAECSSVPLPGNGGKIGGGEIVDVVVCCLSLMGTDWIGMVREARRILKVGCAITSLLCFIASSISSLPLTPTLLNHAEAN